MNRVLLYLGYLLQQTIESCKCYNFNAGMRLAISCMHIAILRVRIVFPLNFKKSTWAEKNAVGNGETTSFPAICCERQVYADYYRTVQLLTAMLNHFGDDYGRQQEVSSSRYGGQKKAGINRQKRKISRDYSIRKRERQIRNEQRFPEPAS